MKFHAKPPNNRDDLMVSFAKISVEVKFVGKLSEPASVGSLIQYW